MMPDCKPDVTAAPVNRARAVVRPPFVRVECGDSRDVLPTLDAESVQCCVTSPPYFGLRNYGVDGQIGLEETPAAYVENIVAVFREVWRVLRADGTLWLNIGDSYNAAGRVGHGTRNGCKQGTNRASAAKADNCRPSVDELKPKDLIGIPWRVAFALQADGWYLRSDTIWHKPNPMPESVSDRPTKSHEYIFLLTKSEHYHYDADAIAEPTVCDRMRGPALHGDLISTNGNSGLARRPLAETRNKRSVWTVPTTAYREAHFATFPPDLIRPCILAGCPVGGIVLDPFGGSGTTGMVAYENARSAIVIELNQDYVKLIKERLRTTGGLPLAG